MSDKDSKLNRRHFLKRGGLLYGASLGLADFFLRAQNAFAYGFSFWKRKVPDSGTFWIWGENEFGNLSNGQTGYSPGQIGSLTTWAEISAGNRACAAIKTDGTLWTWGADYSHFPNIGSVTYSPRQIGAATNWARVSVGDSHFLAVRTDGTMWAWGENWGGQLGQGNTTGVTNPTQVGALTTWSQVAAGCNASFAVKTDGTLWSWGQQNGVGNLGNGSATGDTSSPVQIGAITTWSHVWASPLQGDFSVHARRTNGTLWAWGRNTSGQLGRSDNIDRSAPLQVGALTNWGTVLSKGNSHVTAIKTDGTRWSWGNNSDGQLAVNDYTDRNSPTQVGALTTWTSVTAGVYNQWGIASGRLYSTGRALPSGDITIGGGPSPIQVGATTTWSQIAGPGFSSACLLRRSDNSLWSFGANGGFYEFGTLGRNWRNTPNQLLTWIFKSIAVGSTTTIAVRADGTLWAVGAEGGQGDGQPRSAFTQIGAGTDWQSVGAGSGTILLTKANGTLWGIKNSDSDVVSGSNDSPVQIGAATNWLRADVEAHNQAIGIRRDGSLWSWGGGSAMLGQNDLVARNTPTQIGTATDWVDFSMGDGNVFAWKTNGELWAWGYNTSGSLGDGTSTARSSPVQIGGSWMFVSQSYSTVAGIKTNGTLWTWGDGFYQGALGDGTTSSRNSPVQIGALTTWRKVYGTHYGTFFAIKSDGTLWTWGDNAGGQQGMGDFTFRNSPVQVGTADDWISFARTSHKTVGALRRG